MTRGDEIANWELFLWATALAGGSSDFVDVEEIYVFLFDLAPKRFCWRTRSDLIDKEKCRVALRDADGRDPSPLLKTRDGFRRRLAVQGQDWVSKNDERMKQVTGGGKAVPEPRSRPNVRMLAEVERNDLYREWLATSEISREKWRAAELLRCSPDSDRQVWRDRVQTLRSTANDADRPRLLEFLDQLVADNRSWFEEE